MRDILSSMIYVPRTSKVREEYNKAQERKQMELKSAEQQRKWMKPKIINNF